MSARAPMAGGEFELIDRYFRALGAPRGDVVLGVGDDGAILRSPPDHDLVAVSDTLVEQVHFPAGSPPQSIGHRALAVNLSDVAAMGAVPAWALLSLTLPHRDDRWLGEFAHGFANLALQHSVALVGGDTTRGPLSISVQVLGFLPRGSGLRRSGGRPGDRIFVSGTPGDAAAGLAVLRGEPFTGPAADDAEARDFLQARFEYPTPRLALGAALRDIASACIDVSDGLVGDIGKIAAASACGARIDLERLRPSPALARAASPERAREWLLAGGDDYELVFTVPAARLSRLENLARAFEWQEIGELTAGAGVTLCEQGRPIDLPAASFDHFG